MSESAFNEMTSTEMREILDRLRLSQRGLARMLGTNERTVRRYVSEGKNARNISPELAILLRLLDQRPELLVLLKQHFPEPERQRKKLGIES
jgi:plasmid maintenance system antidote protein VapI